jgi:hypothetical protein
MLRYACGYALANAGHDNASAAGLPEPSQYPEYNMLRSASAIGSRGFGRISACIEVCGQLQGMWGQPAAPTNGPNALSIILTPTSWGVGGWGRDRGRALMRRERLRFYSVHDFADMKI